MKKLGIIILSILSFISAFVSHSHAKSTLDLRHAGVSARTLGMGKASVATAYPSDAVFSNPAATALAKEWGFTSMSTKLMDRVDYKMIGGVYPTANGVFGLGYIGAATPAGYLTTDKDSLTGAQPISYGSNMIVASYAKTFDIGGFKDTAFGVNLKFLNNKFEGFDGSGSGMDADVSVIINPSNNLMVGANLQNFLPEDMGGNLNWKSNTKESIPSIFKIGGSYRPSNALLLAMDLDLAASSSQPVLLHAGVEWKPFSAVSIRGGVDQNPLSSTSCVTDFTAGVGVNFKGFSFDYAYKTNSLVESFNNHYFSLSFDAGQLSDKKEVFEKTMEEVKKPVKNPGEPEFASEKDRDMYLYKIATGKIKPLSIKASASTGEQLAKK